MCLVQATVQQWLYASERVNFFFLKLINALCMFFCPLCCFGLQGSGERLSLTPLLSLGNVLTPEQSPSANQGQPPGDSLLRCCSNPVWWGPSQLAFVGPDGCLQIVQMPSGERVMYVDSQYFLPGSRLAANVGVHGQARKLYVLSAIIQAARYACEPITIYIQS